MIWAVFLAGCARIQKLLILILKHAQQKMHILLSCDTCTMQQARLPKLIHKQLADLVR